MSEPFLCVPLTSDVQHLKGIRSFVIGREKDVSSLTDKVIGLEAYLKRCAWEDDMGNQVRIYLIKDASSGEIAAYFGLKAGMVVDSEDGMPSEEDKLETLAEYGAKLLPEVLPGIEISHFAFSGKNCPTRVTSSLIRQRKRVNLIWRWQKANGGQKRNAGKQFPSSFAISSLPRPGWRNTNSRYRPMRSCIHAG